MGYDLNRFEGYVDEELVCPICSGVLEEPLQVTFWLMVESCSGISLFSVLCYVLIISFLLWHF